MGSSLPPCSRPSTVVTARPSAWTASTVHDLTGVPSRSTVQAPQCVVLRETLAMTGTHITDQEEPPVLADVPEIGDASDVDQVPRGAQPQLQERKEALAAREDLRVVPVGREEPDRLFERPRGVIVERCRNHRSLLCAERPKSSGRTRT